MRRVGVIGLGGMGSALAESLLATGHSVVCFDIRPDALRPVVELGAESAADARELATACDVVLTVLPGPAQVLAVALESDRGVLAGLAEGAAVLDMSTCDPQVATIVGQATTPPVGASWISPSAAKRRNMTVLVGGEPGGAWPRCRSARCRVAHPGVLRAPRRRLRHQTPQPAREAGTARHPASAEALLIAEAIGPEGRRDVADAIAECSGGDDSGLRTAAAYFRQDREAVRSRAPASTIEKDSVPAEKMATTAGIREHARRRGGLLPKRRRDALSATPPTPRAWRSLPRSVRCLPRLPWAEPTS